jgi:hypothetical protein
VLRDAFFYLPTSWAAYRQMQREKELACDDLAVSLTERPLALASALAKVWRETAGQTGLGMAQPLTGAGGGVEGRIERLLAAPRPAARDSRPRAITLALSGSALVGLLALEVVNLALMLAPMGCGPAATLGKLL